MADLGVTYTLTTGSGTIVFNNGVLFAAPWTDLYWISTIHGLDGPTIRSPVDDVPFGDGGLIHKFWKGPRRVGIEGNLIAQSVFGQTGCQAVFNSMTTALATALNSILQTSGTLTWTPDGEAAHSLAVYYEVSLDTQPTDNYRLRSFTFGLISAAADPS